MKSETIISFLSMIEVFFIVFASFGVGLGVVYSHWFLFMTPVGAFFAWAQNKIFDDWNDWHSFCYVYKDEIAKNPYFKEKIKRVAE